MARKAQEPYYGYTITPQHDHYLISYDPGKHGWAALVTIYLGFVILAVFMFMANSHGRNDMLAFFGVVTLILGLPLAFVIRGFLNRFRKKPVEIAVYADEIVADGYAYERRHITSIYVKGPDNVVHSSSQLVVAGSPTVAAGIAAAHDVSRGFNKMMQGLANSEKKKSGWSLWLNYGVKPKKIAKHLDEARATAIFEELGNLLKGQEPMAAAVARR